MDKNGKTCMHLEWGPRGTSWICNKWTTGLMTEMRQEGIKARKLKKILFLVLLKGNPVACIRFSFEFSNRMWVLQVIILKRQC